MTKKLILILAGVILAVGLLGAAGFAYAQVGDTPETDTEDEAQDEFLPGMPGRHRGSWFGFGSGEGVLGDYLFDEVANVFNLSDEAIAAFEKVKETMMGIRDEYSVEEIREMMKEAMTSAINAALADEAITQDQADRMLERMDQFENGEARRPGGRGGFPGDFPGQAFDRRSNGMLGEYMETALAEALGLSVEEFQALKEEEGFNVTDYAVEQNLTVAELQEWLQEVNTNAIQAALEDGAITQDQADRLLENLENFDGRMPFSPFFPGR